MDFHVGEFTFDTDLTRAPHEGTITVSMDSTWAGLPPDRMFTHLIWLKAGDYRLTIDEATVIYEPTDGGEPVVAFFA